MGTENSPEIVVKDDRTVWLRFKDGMETPILVYVHESQYAGIAYIGEAD